MKFYVLEPKHYIAKARSKVKVRATYKRVEALRTRMNSAVHVDLLHGMTSFKKKISAKKIEEAFVKGNYDGIMETIPWDDFDHDLSRFKGKLGGTAFESAAISIPEIPAPSNSKLRFDMKNPNLNEYVNKRTGNLIVGIKSEAKENVREVIERSFNNALTPRQVANEIKSSIGLSPRYAQAVKNYRSTLEAKEMHPDKIESLANKYADRLVDQRCMTIARTETRRATSFGQLEVWKEAADQGMVNREIAKKVWICDGNPCEICEPMDGEEVGLDDVWVLDDGTICEVPSDSHPNCFCGMELSFGEEESEEDSEWIT